jgi:phage-related protein (TIGR01555 family)
MARTTRSKTKQSDGSARGEPRSQPRGQSAGRLDAQSAEQPAAQPRTDGWRNILTGLGLHQRDKRLSSGFVSDLLDEEQLEQLYIGDDMAARIVETVPDEMIRRGFELRIADDTSGIADAMHAELEELRALEHLRNAMVLARLYGGGAVMLGADDREDISKPLNMDAVRSCQWLSPWSSRELKVDSYYSDRRSPLFGEPEVMRVQNFGTRSVPTAREATPLIHETRLVRFSGIPLPRRMLRTHGRGWGLSVLTRCYGILRDYQQAWDGAALLLQDFAPAIFSMKGLAELVGGDVSGSSNLGEQTVLQRVQIADMTRSIARAMLIDTEESFERKTTNVGGLPELLDKFSIRLAAAARIPVTLLMGQAPAGLNATGESDVRWFYDTISAHQERILRPALNRIVQVLFRAKDGPTGGIEPEKWTVHFRPLWEMTDKERAELRLTQAQVDNTYIMAGALLPEEVAISRFGGSEYSTDTKIDLEARQMMADRAPVASAQTVEAAAPAPNGAPAASETGSPDFAA